MCKSRGVARRAFPRCKDVKLTRRMFTEVRKTTTCRQDVFLHDYDLRSGKT